MGFRGERRLIELHNSTIMLEPLAPRGEAALSVPRGRRSASIAGIGVITAYAPVGISGVHWGIVAKIERGGPGPAVALRNVVLATGASIALGVGALAWCSGPGSARPLAGWSTACGGWGNLPARRRGPR